MLCLQGNALLVGVGGSGKQSLAKLAAFMAGCEVFEITLTRGYDEVMFREDLKQLYTMLGADNKKVRAYTSNIDNLIAAVFWLLPLACSRCKGM